MPWKKKPQKDADSSYHKYSGENKPTSTTLIVRLKDRDDIAWDRLKNLYGRLVLDWCRKKKNLKRDDRQDIFQEVFIKAYRSIDQFQKGPENSSFRGWLRSITDSCISDYRRKNKNNPQLLSDTRIELLEGRLHTHPEHEQPTEIDEESERRLLTRRALEIIKEDFDPKTWEAFIRMVPGTETSAEIGQDLGMSSDAVRKAKSRIHKRIREEFGDLID